MPLRPRPDWIELTEKEAYEADEEADVELAAPIKEEDAQYAFNHTDYEDNCQALHTAYTLTEDSTERGN